MKNRLFWSLGASLTILALTGARMETRAEPIGPAASESDAAVAMEDTGDDPAPPSDTDAPATLVSEEKPLPPNIKPTGPVAEVIKLANSGLDESVMLAFVTNSSRAFNLTAEEIIYLKDIGVPGNVITTMIQRDLELKGGAPGPATPTTEPPPPAVYNNEIAPNSANFSATAPPPTQPESVEAPLTPPEDVSAPDFYDSLAPYGNWVDVAGYGQCWQPTVVTVAAGWQPYYDGGHWVYSDCGWYWLSDYSWGWAPFHYGRWFRHSHLGWCWLPGHTWGPSWVSWRYSDHYCGWAPLPPSATFIAGVGLTHHGRHVGEHDDLGLRPGHYRFVAWNHFEDRHLGHDRLNQWQATQVYHQSVVSTRISGYNNTVVNNGLPPSRVAAATGRPVQTVSLREVSQPRGVGRAERYDGNGHTLGVFRPNPNSLGNNQPGRGHQPGGDGTVHPGSGRSAPAAAPWTPRTASPRQASTETPENRPASARGNGPLVLRGPQSSADREHVPPNSLVVIGRQPSAPSAPSAASATPWASAESAPSAVSAERADRAERAVPAPRAPSAVQDAQVSNRPAEHNQHGNWMGTVSSSPQPSWFSGGARNTTANTTANATAAGNNFVPSARPEAHTYQPQPRSFQPAPYQPAPRVAVEVPRYAPSPSYAPQRAYSAPAAMAPSAPAAPVQARPSAPSAPPARSAPAPSNSSSPVRR